MSLRTSTDPLMHRPVGNTCASGDFTSKQHLTGSNQFA